MKHRLYSLYKRKTKSGYMWYVRFWNAGEQRYSITRSTGVLVAGKRGRFFEANDAAREILGTLNYSPTKKTVLEYVADFCKNDSMYIREREKLAKKPLARSTVKKRQGLIKCHIAIYPLFAKLPLVELTTGALKDYMIWLSDRGASNQTIDKAIQTIKTAVREAVVRDELRHDPTKKLVQPAFTYKEKGVLKPDEVKLLVERLTDRDMRVAILLGVLCGMRMGEVRGLQYDDINDNQIIIRHNYQDLDGLKMPKCDSGRMVFFPEILKTDIGTGTGYIFQNRNKCAADKPACTGYFRNMFIKALELIGISTDEQAKRALSFHSLRHTFVTLGRAAGISNMMIQALAGHKTVSMMERYSHARQIINLDEAKEKMKKVIGF